MFIFLSFTSEGSKRHEREGEREGGKPEMAKCEREWPRHENEHQMAMTEGEKSPVEHPHKRDLPTWQAFIPQLARASDHKK